MTGRSIGHYEILEKIGEGGMGVVYKARDNRLDRIVALKVLPPEKVADPERTRRFVQEARAASGLSHPNIITIHDIDTSDGVTFIAMEYVKGNTLDRLISGTSGSLNDTLRHAIQIADALAAAHTAGVIHRDIKPANVMVTQTGQAKVLDFGLAKLTEKAATVEDQITRTLEAKKTAEGTIVGTIAYMSPEQAEGKHIDARSDIFSFGSLLYEMATGRRAFSGETQASTLAAILREEPKPASEVAPAIPREMDRIISRCLRKDPSRRYQHMADLRVALEEVKEESESARQKVVRQSPPRRLALAAIAACVLVTAVGTGVAWLGRSTKSPSRPPLLTRLTSDAGFTAHPTISRDGKLLAYASDRSGQDYLDIWVRQIAGGDPVRVTHDPAGASHPSFSPDSSKIVFRSERDGGGVYVAPSLGGDDRLLGERGHTPRFSPDGAWVSFTRQQENGGGAVFIVSSNGGSPRRITPQFETAFHPVWSPDGKYLLFRGGPEFRDHDWWLAAIEGGPPVKTGAIDALRRQGIRTEVADAIAPGEWVDDQVFFSATAGSSTNLWRVALDPRTRHVTGPPLRLTFGTGTEIEPSVSADLQGSLRLVFASQTSNLDIWSLPLDADRGRVIGELQRVTADAAGEGRPSLSADGKKMSFESARAGTWQINLKDLETGKERALTVPPVDKHHSVMSADASRVFYTVAHADLWSILSVSAAGGEAETLCNDCYLAEDLSPDNNKLLFGNPDPARKVLFGVFLMDLNSKKRSQLLSHPQWSLWGPSFSPDGRWISFHASGGSEPRGAWIAPFRENTTLLQKDWVAVAESAAEQTRWSPDGNLLYYLSPRDGFLCLWAQRLAGTTKRPAGSPFAVYHSHSVGRSIGGTPDYQRRPTVLRGKVLLTLNELTSNIWMTELQPNK